MALEGTLDSFGLPEVLALLAMTGKSGRLALDRGDVTGEVRLRDGVIVSASSDDSRRALARRLVVTCQVGRDALRAAVARTDVPVEVAVTESAGLDAVRVLPVARAQVTDAVFELLRWDNGRFAFHPEEFPASPTDASLSVEETVTEGRRRLAAWPELTGRLPRPAAVLALNTTLAAEASFNPAEWELLALLDGHRSIGEAVALATQGEWAAMSLLAGLVERTLLVPVEETASARHRADLLTLLDTGTSTVAADPTTPAAPAPDPTPAPAPEIEAFTELSQIASGFAAAEPEPEPAPEPEPEPAPFSDEVPGLAPRDTPWSAAPEASTTAVPDLDHDPAATGTPADGIDEDLLQRLISGVRAL